MTNKEKYQNFCKLEKNIPIFNQSWWLDAVCNHDWEVVLIENNGEIIAAMPYFVIKKLGFDIISMPKLTQNMGPYIKYPDNQKYHKKLSYEKEVMTKLINKLPAFDSYSKNFNYSITNLLPFHWKGFKQSTRYTYILDDMVELESVIDNFSSECRNNIEKARRKVKIIEDDNLGEFYKIVKMSFDRQNINIPYSYNFLKMIDNASTNNNSRKILFAIDQNNDEVHAAIYLIWDGKSVYLLASGGNPSLRNSGAKYLLVLKAITFAIDNGLIFDFEGSMIENVEKFNRSFGARQQPYSNITKINSHVLGIKKILKEL